MSGEGCTWGGRFLCDQESTTFCTKKADIGRKRPQSFKKMLSTKEGKAIFRRKKKREGEKNREGTLKKVIWNNKNNPNGGVVPEERKLFERGGGVRGGGAPSGPMLLTVGEKRDSAASSPCKNDWGPCRTMPGTGEGPDPYSTSKKGKTALDGQKSGNAKQINKALPAKKWP